MLHDLRTESAEKTSHSSTCALLLMVNQQASPLLTHFTGARPMYVHMDTLKNIPHFPQPCIAACYSESIGKVWASVWSHHRHTLPFGCASSYGSSICCVLRVCVVHTYTIWRGARCVNFVCRQVDRKMVGLAQNTTVKLWFSMEIGRGKRS